MTAFQPSTPLVQSHRDWLDQFDAQHRKSWEQLLAAEPEAAGIEAAVRRFLCDCGVSVEPNTDLLTATTAPDLRCRKNGHTFYVEATCILIETATRATGLPNEDYSGLQMFKGFGLNEVIFQDCQNKTPQCASVNAPCIVAVGTFHSQATMACIKKVILQGLWTGKPRIAWDVDMSGKRPPSEAYQVTNLWPAVPIKPGQGVIQPARSAISGVLVGGFCFQPLAVYGLLHPRPIHAFDHTLLDEIPFCQMPEFESGNLKPEWLPCASDTLGE